MSMSTTDLTHRAGSKAIRDPEILAIAAIQRQLRKLEPRAQRRVLEFFTERLRTSKESA